MIPKKTLQALVVQTKRGLSSYYLGKEGKEYPYINISDLKEGRINSGTVSKTKLKDTGLIDKSKLTPGDIIISVKGSAFKAAITDQTAKDYVFSANLIALTLSKEIMPDIVVAYLNSPQGQKELHTRAVGVAQKAITLQRLMTIEIPVPSLEKQKALAEYFKLTTEHKELSTKEEQLRQQIQDRIVAKHMTG